MRQRDYQTAAVDHLWTHMMNGGGNSLVVMPTGTGKSPTMAWFIQKLLTHYPRLRILSLASRKELIDGNYQALMRIMPTAPAGIYSAGLKRKDIGAQVTFAGISSIIRRTKLFLNTDIIIVDEAHEVSDERPTTYAKLFKSIQAINPHLQIIGFTATDFRMGLGKLTEGGVFKSVCFDLSSGDAFVWMVEQGYLSPLIPKAMETTVDTTGVGSQNGEFLTNQLVKVMKEQNIIDRALDEAVESASERARWLVFATSIEQTEEIAEKLNDRGITAKAVHSKMPDKERDQVLKDHKAGKFQAIVNKDILTTGYDDAGIDCIVMLRPTKSPGLWVQMLGRGTRPIFADGYNIDTQAERLEAISRGPKPNCLVLDFAGNTMSLGPINYPKIPKRKGAGGGEAPVRVCPTCKTMVHISIAVCPDCGFVFPVEEKISARAGSAEIIAMKKPEPPEKHYAVFPVTQMIATKHQKIGRPDSVRVDYVCGTRRFTDWLGPEHYGPLRTKARVWWGLHSPQKEAPAPRTVERYLELFNTMRTPTHIKVWINTKYPEVIDYDFSNRGFAFPSSAAHGGGAAALS